ncbi:PD-(D/E)XK nuclease family protein, partial [Gordonibacter pamelaeae]
YLECPCKWFSLRRLRLSAPDAGFGPLEMGSFSHGVLKSFYEHFIEMGNAKVAPGNLEEARALMRETFARHLAFQPELKRKANPLLPLTAFERAEAHGLERRLVSYLDREAALLPGFSPAFFELDFGTREPFAYGGFELRGSVDRIDVNGRGQAVVIDYKGSLSPDYALSSASPAATAGGAMLPHKVQALV